MSFAPFWLYRSGDRFAGRLLTQLVVRFCGWVPSLQKSFASLSFLPPRPAPAVCISAVSVVLFVPSSFSFLCAGLAAAFLAAACSLLRPCCGPWRRIVFALFCQPLVCECPQSGQSQTRKSVAPSISLVAFVSARLHRRSLPQQVAPSPGWAQLL